MIEKGPKFYVGQLIHHLLFNYRGVIIDVDPQFAGTEEWYETVAKSRPIKDRPWYHVLVHNAAHLTYVAEQNLEPDSTLQEINHPLVNEIFERFDKERYLRNLQ